MRGVINVWQLMEGQWNEQQRREREAERERQSEEVFARQCANIKRRWMGWIRRIAPEMRYWSDEDIEAQLEQQDLIWRIRYNAVMDEDECNRDIDNNRQEAHNDCINKGGNNHG